MLYTGEVSKMKTPPRASVSRWFRSESDTVAAIFLLLPSLLFLAVFTYWPIIQTIDLSLHDFSLGSSERHFTGLDNFERVYDDDLFWRVMKNTIAYTVITLPVATAVALSMALLVNGKLKAAWFYRTAFFYPVMIPSVAAALVWVFILAPGYGLMSHALDALGLPPIEWLYSSSWALPAIILVSVWKLSGYFMIIMLAGLQLIPDDLYEAADLEGATLPQKLFHITLPLLSPTLYFILIIGLLHTFQIFDYVYVMTAGGPADSTNVLIYLIYQNAFRYWDIGYAATLALIFIALSTVTLLIIGATVGRKIFYQGS